MKVVERETQEEEFYEIRDVNTSTIVNQPNIQRVPVQTGLKITRRLMEVPVDEG